MTVVNEAEQERRRQEFLEAGRRATQAQIAQSDAARGAYTLRQAERDALKFLSRPHGKGAHKYDKD